MADFLFSGAAEGSDAKWGLAARVADHDIRHYSFDGHKYDPSVLEEEIQTLSDGILMVADIHLKGTAKRIGRKFPPRSLYVKRLLQRNFYQIVASESLYAVGMFKYDGSIDGGTAWAVDMFSAFHHMEKFPMYFFNQPEKVWYFKRSGENEWNRMSDIPPIPQGPWTGIGTRALNADGEEAIDSVFRQAKKF